MIGRYGIGDTAQRSPEGEVGGAEQKTEAESEVKTEGEAEIKAEPKVETEAKPQNEDWRLRKQQQRIDKLTAQKAELEAALAARQAGGNAPDPAAEVALSAKIEELANEKAKGIAAKQVEQQSFDKATEEAVRTGRETYGEVEFNKRASSLAQLIDRTDQNSVQQYVQFINAAVETGECAKIVFLLGDDLNEASRLMALSPIKMGIALAKLAAKEIEEISNAPKPIKPIGGRGAPHVKIDPSDPTKADMLSTTEWMARREAEVQESRKRMGR